MTTTATTTELLTECRNRGIELSLWGDGFKCNAPAGSMTPELHTALGARRDDIRRYLVVQQQPAANENTNDIPSLSLLPADIGALADFVLLLTADNLPTAPIELLPHCQIVDTERFLRSLQADIGQGTTGPRYRSGALQDDLRRLGDLLLKV